MQEISLITDHLILCEDDNSREISFHFLLLEQNIIDGLPFDLPSCITWCDEASRLDVVTVNYGKKNYIVPF